MIFWVTRLRSGRWNIYEAAKIYHWLVVGDSSKFREVSPCCLTTYLPSQPGILGTESGAGFVYNDPAKR